jgi:hypothetical protein
MSSVRFDASYSQSPRRSPTVKKSSKLVESLNLLERRSFDLSNAICSSVTSAAQKTPSLEHIDTSWANSESSRTLLKRCENYCRHIAAQPNKTLKHQKEEIERTKAKLTSALEELESFKEAENVRLDRSLAATQEEFTRKVKDLERAVLKQIDAFKVGLIEDMRRKEKETEARILAKSEQLAQGVAPASKAALVERSVSKSPGRSILRSVSAVDESPVKRQTENSQRALLFTPEQRRSTPVFSYSFTSNSEKKASAKLTLQRLEESRQKVMRLGNVYTDSDEALKPNAFSTPSRRIAS